MAKKRKFNNWSIMEGSTKTVYDRETGTPSEEVVSPWCAEYLGPYGSATLYSSSMAGILAAIAAHPFENGRAPEAPQIEVNAGVQPDPNTSIASLADRVAALEAEAK